ncbi:PucR family transcriptional regulator ligand-binding domain-containing protein [Fictibacillus sp. Mic-4]|uniref:PucR family transcriptional regulator n=1 Tax=Fictibacillus TaxID=1329200 RepID=UPI00040A3131|nr:PucR family transcriptional regulator [Fictibacillus gelatini]
MKFTVEKALKIQSLKQCKVVAGSRGLNRSIRSVSIMDCPDTSWLKRGDLLLTTGYVFKDDQEAQIKLIKDLAERECAGLAIKVKRFLPSIPEPMLQEANRLGLPVLEIPYELVLSDMLIALTREILARESLYNEETRKKHFFSTLFGGEFPTSDSILSQGQEYGLLPGCEYGVLYFSIKEQDNSPLISVTTFQQVINRVSATVNVNLLGVQFEDFVAIIQARRLKEPFERVARKAAERILSNLTEHVSKEMIAVGIGTKKTIAGEIHSSFQEAKEAIYLGHRVTSGTCAIYEYTALEPEALLQHLPDHVLKRYFTATMGTLVKYDEQNNSDLLNTLEVYLNCGAKLGEAARILYVHRNTVKFRISRIEELLGMDLNDGEVAFRLQLGLCAARLLGLLTRKTDPGLSLIGQGSQRG